MTAPVPLGADIQGFLRPSRGEKVSRVPGGGRVVVQPVLDFGMAGRSGVVGGTGEGVRERDRSGSGDRLGEPSKGHRVERSVNLVIETV